MAKSFHLYVCDFFGRTYAQSHVPLALAEEHTTFPWSLWESEYFFLECFVLPLRSTHCWEMRSWRSSVECTFSSTSHPSLANTQLSASILKLFKLASSDYTSNTTDGTCHLGSIISICLTGQSYCKDTHSSIPRSEKNTNDCSKVTPWGCFSESTIHKADPQLVCVTPVAIGPAPQTGSGMPSWSCDHARYDLCVVYSGEQKAQPREFLLDF